MSQDTKTDCKLSKIDLIMSREECALKLVGGWKMIEWCQKNGISHISSYLTIILLSLFQLGNSVEELGQKCRSMHF